MTTNDETWTPRLRVRWDPTDHTWRWVDDDQPLTFDECETLDLDGTGRTMSTWGVRR